MLIPLKYDGPFQVNNAVVFGDEVGAPVGANVGVTVGVCVGANVGVNVGAIVIVGATEGSTVILFAAKISRNIKKIKKQAMIMPVILMCSLKFYAPQFHKFCCIFNTT